MTEIELSAIRKEYDDGTIGVKDLDLTIEDGEFLVLVGPSGCGKTTTLEMVAGLLHPTDGEIRFDERVVNELSPRNRGIAMVFQNYALYPHMTTRGNIEFGLKYTTDMTADERAEKAVEVAEMLEIDELLDDKPKELSGGQQQRVALGRAIVRDPDVFLMDEPLSNLDAKLRTTMRSELQRLQNDLGITTIYVTHDQTEAMTMGDRIAVLNEGELQQVGTPTELYNIPTNTFVAGFIGSPSMNFIEGNMSDDVFHCDHFELGISGVEYGGKAKLGIRPEDIQIVDQGHPAEITRAQVRVVEEMGNENLLYLQTGDKEFLAMVGESINPAIGDSLSIAFPEDRTYLFDEDEEQIKARKIEEDGGPMHTHEE